MIIKPSTALRNDYGTISDLAHQEAEPIHIIKSGEGDLVVMSIEAFEHRYMIAGKYICVYRLIVETVFVYRIAHETSNYPTLFKQLLKDENQTK